MQEFDPQELKKLYIPPADSRKGENGKLLLIGGSHLFHAASLWALESASKIVDMVFYASVPENNEVVQNAKKEFRNGIVVRREDIEHYVAEADAILIGPGMMRAEGAVDSMRYKVLSIKEINQLEDEGEQTYYLTKYLLEKYPEKKWIIDGGALQMMEIESLQKLSHVILTPNVKEFGILKEKIKDEKVKMEFDNLSEEEQAGAFAKEYNCVIVFKGKEDIVCSPTECRVVSGGNAGMTKGGTGDVLAGLIGALATKNDLFLSGCAGSYINKKAGEKLYETVGLYFNSSDLIQLIQEVMKELVLE